MTTGWFTFGTSDPRGYFALESCGVFHVELPANVTRASFYLRVQEPASPTETDAGFVRFSIGPDEGDRVESEPTSLEKREVRVEFDDPPAGPWTWWATPDGAVANHRFEAGVEFVVAVAADEEPPAVEWVPNDALCADPDA